MPANKTVTDLLQKIADRQTVHEVEVAKIATLVTNMNTRLFGNGQPGALHYLSEETKRVSETLDELDKRVTEVDGRIDVGDQKSLDEVQRVDKKFIWVSGMTAGAGAVLGFVGNFFTRKLGL